jgi:hypothetical protein
MVSGAKASIVGAAKTGAKEAKLVAGEALGAAAAAATEVVLSHVANALSTGEKKIGAAKPRVTQSARATVSAPFGKSKKDRARPKNAAKSKSAGKSAPSRKPSSRGR